MHGMKNVKHKIISNNSNIQQIYHVELSILLHK